MTTFQMSGLQHLLHYVVVLTKFSAVALPFPIIKDSLSPKFVFWCLCRHSCQPPAFDLSGKATGGLPHPCRLQHHQAQHDSCGSAPDRRWFGGLCGCQQQQLSGKSCLLRESTSMEALHIRAEHRRQMCQCCLPGIQKDGY